MGVMYDYFAAESDDAAAATIDRVGGPGSQSVLVVRKRSIFSRRDNGGQPEFGTDPSLLVHDTVSVKGIDPVMQMGILEELLTGRPYDDVMADPRGGQDLAVRDGGAGVVLTLTDQLASALAAASEDVLASVAQQWALAEEFAGRGDPEALLAFLVRLGALARRAEGSGQRLYCWLRV
jgi:hypothetical protein